MFEDFFENNAPADEVKPNAAHTQQIKAAVMERIAQVNAESEEKKMKRRYLRPFVIAAAAAAVGTGSLVTADAATNGIVADTITKAFTVFSGNDAEQSGAWTEVDDGEYRSVVYYTLPDDNADSPDLGSDTTVIYEWIKENDPLPDDKAGSPDLEVETIRSDDWSVVYYTVTDDKEDVIYDYIFTLEKNGSSK